MWPDAKEPQDKAVTELTQVSSIAKEPRLDTGAGLGTLPPELRDGRNVSAKPVIFISYSHKDEPKKPGPKDERWLSFVQSHLAPAVKHGMYELWADEDIPGGGAWRQEITRKLDECDVCVLLVSRHSLASDFIIDVEIETLRKRRAKGDAEIFPIVLTPCAVETAPWIKEIQLRPPNGQPLSDFEENERHKQMAAIAKEIARIAQTIAQRKSSQERASVPIGAAIGAVLSVGSLAAAGIGRTMFDSRNLHISNLPETAYEHLVGRDEELKKLDDAWEDKKTNILSLIAEGGAGKSALVNEWLKRMQADSYRSAEVVLGWSFYSQGTKERATSADPFLNWALEELGVEVKSTSATAKGDAIAEALMRRRVLLVLDGVEPLQHGPDGQLGQLKDQGLRALLRRFAAAPAEAHGLIVLTSRLAIKDIDRWKDSAAPVLDLEKLSDDAGAALLRDNGVWGTDRELRLASHDFGGHPLALGLLASFLKETQNGDVRRRDHFRGLDPKAENPGQDHAARVMESYEKEWLAGRPDLLAIMQAVGLFDRPASEDCLMALRKKPHIAGLTDEVVKMDDVAWSRAVARLREVRLLSPEDPAATASLDAHPLVREWFGERLRKTSEDAWKSAHSRLFDHLRRTTHEGAWPALEQLTPLFQAIAHGCRAGRHQEALDDVYKNRICKRDSVGKLVFFASKMLGAYGSSLAAVSWLFDKPYQRLVETLRESDQPWVLNEAAIGLRAMGRLAEAMPAMRAGLRMDEQAENWGDAVAAAANLSQMALVAGNVADAVGSAQTSVTYADRSNDEFQSVFSRTTLADALHAAGRFAEAERLFVRAERLQSERQPEYPLLYSLQGYEYCDLLLGGSDFATVRDRASKILEWEVPSDSLLSRSLVRLTFGRAHFGLSVIGARTGASEAARAARAWLDEAIDGLRASEQSDHLPRGLLARAAFHRCIGDMAGATRDLDEVEEIAEPGPMRLFLCDLALERARLAFERIEAFAPLNGMVEDSPPKPEVPSEAERKSLRDEASKQIGIAAKLIEECGYHRRDAELAELQSVLKGERKFADLPVHV